MRSWGKKGMDVVTLPTPKEKRNKTRLKLPVRRKGDISNLAMIARLSAWIWVEGGGGLGFVCTLSSGPVMCCHNATKEAE